MPFDPTWLSPPKEKGVVYTHVIIVCDTFDHEDYPVYVKAGESVKERFAHYNGPNMQRVMEVYDLTESEKTLQQQQMEHRSHNFGKQEGPKYERWLAIQRLANYTDDDLKKELERRTKSREQQAEAFKKVVAAETARQAKLNGPLPPLDKKGNPIRAKRESYRTSNKANASRMAERRAKLTNGKR